MILFLHRKIHGNKCLSIKDDRRAIAMHYLKHGHGQRVQKGTPISFLGTSKSNVSDKIRYDQRCHLFEKTKKTTSMSIPKMLLANQFRFA